MCEFVQTIISFCESVVMCCSEWGMWNPWIGSVPNLEELNYNVIGPVTDCTLNKVYRCVKADVDQSMVFIKEIFMPDGYNTAVQTSISAKTSFFRFHGHPNIIRELRSFRRGNYMYIVYEYFSVDLSNFISFPKIQRDPQTRLILQQILSAVKHCHSYDIILGDIKPKYIQINFTARLIKLADFGFAGAYGDPWASYPIKPSQYSAPELLFRTRQHSKAADMWSVGCIFGELVIGKPVFQGTTTREQLVSIFRFLGTPTEESWPGVSRKCRTISCFPKYQPQNLAENFPGLEPAGIDLLSKMLCLDPRERISAEDALEHGYFNFNHN